MYNESWCTKYEPKLIDDLIIQNKSKIKKIIENIDLIPNLILHGLNNGIGKKTFLNVLSHKIENDKLSDKCFLSRSPMIKFDCSKPNFISEFESQEERLYYKTLSGNKRIVVFEDFDCLDNESTKTYITNAIIKFSKLRNIFIIKVKDINSLPISLLNQCYQIDFSNPSQEEIFERLKFILEQEQVKYFDDSLNEIVDAFYPNISIMINYCQYNNEDLIKKNLQLNRINRPNSTKQEINYTSNLSFEKILDEKLNLISQSSVNSINLQELYKQNVQDYIKWINSKPFGNSTKVNHISLTRRIFMTNRVKNVNDYVRLLQKENVCTINSFRKFIEFCYTEKNLISPEQYNIINGSVKKPKKEKKTLGVDTTTPTSEQLKSEVNLIRKCIDKPLVEVRSRPPLSEIDLLLYTLSIESCGVRWESIEKLLLRNFDKKRLYTYGEISAYNIIKPNIHQDDMKLGIFLICRTKTLNRILEIINEDKDHFINKVLVRFKDTLVNRHMKKQITKFKLHRNYGNFVMKKYKIDMEMRNFIQSRDSGEINLETYLLKLPFAIDEYKKLLPHWEELLDEK